MTILLYGCIASINLAFAVTSFANGEYGWAAFSLSGFVVGLWLMGQER